MRFTTFLAFSVLDQECWAYLWQRQQEHVCAALSHPSESATVLQLSTPLIGLPLSWGRVHPWTRSFCMRQMKIKHIQMAWSAHNFIDEHHRRLHPTGLCKNFAKSAFRLTRICCVQLTSIYHNHRDSIVPWLLCWSECHQITRLCLVQWEWDF